MKKLNCFLATGALTLMLAGSAGGSPFITITDLTDGSPVVTTDLLNAVTSTSAEFADITGNLVPATSPNPLRAGSTVSVILMEDATHASDILTLSAGAINTDPIIGLNEPIEVMFWSDGAAGFDAALNALPPNTPRLLEDGTLQDLSSLLGSANSITIKVQSDLDAGPETVPDAGSTGSLLALAALILVAGRRLGRQSASTI